MSNKQKERVLLMQTLLLIKYLDEYLITDEEPNEAGLLKIDPILDAVAMLSDKDDEMLVVDVFNLGFSNDEALDTDELMELIADNLVDMLNDGVIQVLNHDVITYTAVENRNRGIEQHYKDVLKHYDAEA